MQILIIDDSKEITNAIKGLLKFNNPNKHEILEFGDYSEILEAFQSGLIKQPCTILLDHDLPGANGDVVFKFLDHSFPELGIDKITLGISGNASRQLEYLTHVVKGVDLPGAIINNLPNFEAYASKFYSQVTDETQSEVDPNDGDTSS